MSSERRDRAWTCVFAAAVTLLGLWQCPPWAVAQSAPATQPVYEAVVGADPPWTPQSYEQFGATLLRIDIPDADPAKGMCATQFYGGGAIYCVTPTTEEIARGVARSNQPTPVQRWELPAPSAVDYESPV